LILVFDVVPVVQVVRPEEQPEVAKVETEPKKPSCEFTLKAP
jgi:hypothetical protein